MSKFVKGSLAAALLVSLLVALVPSAGALTVYKSGQYPGTATIPKARVIGDQGYCDPSGCVIDLNAGYFVNPARVIYENATYRNNWQYVCVTHRLWKWTPLRFSGGQIIPGFWKVQARSQPSCGYISPAQTAVNTPKHQFSVDQLDNSYYALDVVVTWQLQSGYLLGKKTYDYDALADYVCDPGVCITRGIAEGGGAYISI